MATTFQAPSCGTPAAVAERARVLCAAREDAEREIVFQATVWADLHPDPDDTPGPRPGVTVDAGAGLAAALGLRSEAGDHLLEEALELRHRLPLVWAQLLAGELPAWRARRIAQATVHEPDDVATAVDAQIAPIAPRVGPVTLERIIDEVLLRLRPEEHAERRRAALSARHVRFLQRCNAAGVAEMIIAADAKDLHDFDQTVTDLAHALSDVTMSDADGSVVPLEERRAMAIGILADPARALTLLEGEPEATGGRARRKRVELVVHLSHDALHAARDGVGRLEVGGGIPVLAEAVRDWCARPDSDLVVRPVIDTTGHEAVAAYEIPDRLKLRVDARDHTCVFPYCHRPARRCDHDHNQPHAQGGATCECNLAPLCRRHHVLKTHHRWTYTILEPGTYLWSSPHGDRYLRDNQGTGNITPQIRPRHDACFHPPGPSG